MVDFYRYAFSFMKGGAFLMMLSLSSALCMEGTKEIELAYVRPYCTCLYLDEFTRDLDGEKRIKINFQKGHALLNKDSWIALGGCIIIIDVKTSDDDLPEDLSNAILQQRSEFDFFSGDRLHAPISTFRLYEGIQQLGPEWTIELYFADTVLSEIYLRAKLSSGLNPPVEGLELDMKEVTKFFHGDFKSEITIDKTKGDWVEGVREWNDRVRKIVKKK